VNDVEVCDSADECGEDIANHNELQFTGNWFIDAGILGFVNLMEEVYGWDLEKLQKMVKENPEVVYCWHFPIGFVYYNNKLRGKPPITLPQLPESLQNPKELFENAWEFIYNTFLDKEKNRIDLSSKGSFYYFHNLLFFQPRWDAKKQKDAFMEILRLKKIEKEVLRYIDKTVNKFLPSMDEFSNILYSRGFITLETLIKLHPASLIFVLSFPFSFIEGLLPENVLFYSPNLKFTYSVNKRLRGLLERSEGKSSLFQMTWRSIIDVVVETQSIWTLENMYLIKYALGKNQNILNAEFIGISKLQASILIEDPIRDALNVNLQIEKDKRVWILEEFIKNKPLYKLILKHISYCLRDKNGKGIQRKASLYALSIDAKIKENNNIDLFSDGFLEGYRSLVNEIKDCYLLLNLNANFISHLFDSEEERSQICYSLLSALKKRNRIAFANVLLKKFLEKAGSKEVSWLNRFVFENIVSNDISWENYALALVIGILSFGGGNGGEESEE